MPPVSLRPSRPHLPRPVPAHCRHDGTTRVANSPTNMSTPCQARSFHWRKSCPLAAALNLYCRGDGQHCHGPGVLVASGWNFNVQLLNPRATLDGVYLLTEILAPHGSPDTDTGLLLQFGRPTAALSLSSLGKSLAGELRPGISQKSGSMNQDAI